MNPPDLQKFITEVASAYGLGTVQAIQPLGGTATPKWTINTNEGRYVVRIRPDEFSDTGQSTLTHQALIKLADAGLPVPRPLIRSTGETLYNFGDSVIEVLEWIDGDIWSGESPEALRNVGIFLAKFHAILGTDFSSSSEIDLREDHPDALQAMMNTLLARACDAHSSDQLNAINGLIQQGRYELEATLYPSLPRAVIHGDFHAVIFFASDRPTVFEPDDIRSLTQPFTPNLTASRAVLAGYQSMSLLTSDEWQALPLLLRSRWIQMRLRGSRKVSVTEQFDFVLTDFSAVTDWLTGDGRDFFTQLRHESPA